MSKTYTNRSNARRAGVQAGIPVELVEITVHKAAGEKPRFGFKRKEKPAQKATQKPVKPTAAPRDERHGVARPRAGGLCAAVWDALDKMHAGGMQPTTKQVRELAIAKRWSENNAVCELSRWRRYMGVARTHNMKPKKQKAQAKAAPPATRVDGSVDQYLA